MGATVSALVFQPPRATYGYTRRYFFLATSRNNRIPAFFIEHEYVEAVAGGPDFSLATRALDQPAFLSCRAQEGRVHGALLPRERRR